jgi:hypothetical protein
MTRTLIKEYQSPALRRHLLLLDKQRLYASLQQLSADELTESDAALGHALARDPEVKNNLEKSADSRNLPAPHVV